MASLRRSRPMPVPVAELARLKDTLHEQYGNALVDGQGEAGAVLVVRVPRDEPDMVNDVEACIEYLNPGEVADAACAVFVGHATTLEVPPQMLRDLMAARLQFDRRQCHLLRGQLKHGEHRLFKAPEDPRRLVRLALRCPRARVAEVSEEDLEAAARELGPKMMSPAYREVRSVYLIADKDDVRMDADLFFQDLQVRWTEESERRRLAQEIVEKEESKRREEAGRRILAEAERQRLLARAEAPAHPARIAVAPLRRRAAAGEWTADADPQRAEMYAFLDSLETPAGATAGARMPYLVPDELPGAAARRDIAPPRGSPLAGAALEGSVRDLSGPLQAPTAPTPSPPPPSPTVEAVAAALRERGFECLVRPGAHAIDVAAERPAGYPARLIAFCPPRLDLATADAVLATAAKLQVDLALVVCAEADAEARKRFVATRARWIDPAELGGLAL